MKLVTVYTKYFSKLYNVLRSKESSNALWLVFDKLLRFLFSFITGILVARYLGAHEFGILSYAQAYVSIFSTIALLGLDSIVVRELIIHPEKEKEILGSAFLLKLVSGTILFVLSSVIYYLFSPNNVTTAIIITIISASIIFQAFDSIAFWYQAKLLSKYVVIAKNLALILGSIAKIAVIYFKGQLVHLAIVSSLELSIGSIFLFLIFKKQKNELLKFYFSYSLGKKLLKKSWPLVFSSLSIIIYMRIDQIMIEKMIGSEGVGLYTTATRLSEAWYFIPTAIITSTFPSIIEAKKESELCYYRKIGNLLLLLVLIGYIISFFISIFSKEIIVILYGSAYQEASTVLTIHIWASIFVFIHYVTGNWLINENLQIVALYRNLVGAIFNIILNIYLIPSYGITGAAIATLISYIVVIVSPIMFSKAYKKILPIVFRALLLRRI
jgi:polysaccharide transporter, PST family